MINLLNLEYFLVAAKKLNFTRAARKLYIFQQSLSNHIPNLEKRFDVILFDRTSPPTLIYAGRALKIRVRELLDLRDETYKEISDIRDFSTGQFSIDVSHMHGRAILPETLSIYQSQFPGIELHLAEGSSSQLASDLLHESIDPMIDLPPSTAENVETVPICNEEILMVVSDDILEKAYPGQVEGVKEKLRATSDIRILEHYPSVLLKEGNRVCTIADEILENVQISPRIVLETGDTETVLALSGKGTGIIFYSKMFMSLDPVSRPYRSVVLKQNHLNLYSPNYTRAHGALGISHREDRYMSRAAHEFTRIAREWLDHTPKK